MYRGWLNCFQTMEFGLQYLENIVGKGEHTGYQHFLPFPWCFQKVSFSGLFKLFIVCGRVNECFFLYSLSAINGGLCLEVKYWKRYTINAFLMLIGKMVIWLNLYQTSKFLDWTKLKAFAEINVTEKLKFVLDREENILGKCWLPAFFRFSTMFSEGC